MDASTNARLVCVGCGTAIPPEDPYPFRCPSARPDDDVDHLVTRTIDADALEFPRPAEANPFVRYRALFHSYRLARTAGMSDGEYCDLVRALDERVEAVDGKGFVVTPFESHPKLDEHLALPAGTIHIKDETGNVAGSHKARHLMGVLIHLELVERLGFVPAEDRQDRPLVIASCGNAALAAAVLARAAERPLRVFIPTWAETAIVERLQDLQAELVVCERQPDTQGDPCYLAFLEAVQEGALPFCCQGPSCGLTIDGGRTLGYELASACLDQQLELNRIFLQVGGGALASSTIQGLQEADLLGALPGGMPRVHAVQATGNAPFVRACKKASTAVSRADAPEDEAIAIVLNHAATHRSDYMQPWGEEPTSLATGILDDETYDWLAVLYGVLDSGGSAVLAHESTIKNAVTIARECTDIPAGPTGTAGLAGLLQLQEKGASPSPDAKVAVLFTGRT